MTHHGRSWIAVALAGGLLAAATPVIGTSALRDPISRRVYVTVTDDKGGYVTDLTPADFTLKEGGKERAILKIEPATAPMQIAVLVEESLGGDQNVRKGVYDMVQRVLDRSKVGIFVVGRRNVAVTDYTSDLQAVINGINKFGLNSVTQDENLTEGVYEAARSLEQGEAARRVIIAVAIENQQASSMMPEQAMDELQKSGALFYAVTLPGSNGSAGLGAMVDESSRGKILGDGTKQTGGRRQEVTTTPGMPRVLMQFADELLHQYVITYTLPDGVKPDSRLNLAMKRKGLNVKAPSRIPDK